MSSLSRIITGITMIVLGLALVLVWAFNSFKEGAVVSIFDGLVLYGIPILIIGSIILFNKKEDEIEQIKKHIVKGGKK